jgi:hypothetical protein
MSKGIKRTIIVILILVILAGMWTGGRYIYLKQRYAPFCAAVNEETLSVLYDEKYTCGVAKPESLLSLRGNLYVSAMRHITKNEDEEAYCDLIIYVEFPKGYTIYAQLCDAYGNSYDELKLTENMELVSDDDSAKQLYQEYYDAIYDAFYASNEVFGIFELPN